ncbi:MAG: AAA family ATPase [Terriglobales bacterium]
MNNPNLFVITGGPGSGKTTVILALEKLGFGYAPEVAPEIIQEQVRDGGHSESAAADKRIGGRESSLALTLLGENSLLIGKIQGICSAGRDPPQIARASNNSRCCQISTTSFDNTDPLDTILRTAENSGYLVKPKRAELSYAFFLVRHNCYGSGTTAHHKSETARPEPTLQFDGPFSLH